MSLGFHFSYIVPLLERNHAAVVCIVDVLLDRIGLERIHQRLNAGIVLIALLDCDHIHLGLCCLGIGLLVSHRILRYGEACLHRIVAI